MKTIGKWAFGECYSLSSVTIGNGVKAIGVWSFGCCPNLRNIYCYAEEVPSTENDAFNDSYSEYAKLHVPAASIESYMTTAPWSKFGKIVALTDKETGIGEVKQEGRDVKSSVYDLFGRPVQKAQKGIHIQNGKKILVK